LSARMKLTHHLGWLLFAIGCSSDASNDIEFHGEQPVLPDFTMDTGLQPAGSPVQLQLMFSVGGTLAADAKATAGGSGTMLVAAAVPGSGTFTLDAHVKLMGTLHIDVSGKKYDGPIPGIENIDIAFGANTTFDPFLLDGKAHVTATLPKIPLPPIPLPGGLPGHLQITVAEGSTMSSDLAGTCAGTDSGKVEFRATTSTSANLVLESEIVLTLPIVGDKTFSIPEITVAIPAFDAPLDLGTFEVAGGGTPPMGASLATPGGCSNPGGGDGGDGGGNGATCTPNLVNFVPTWHPPNGAHAGACDSGQLTAFTNACLTNELFGPMCLDFLTANPSCGACLVTDSSAPGYGVLIRYPIAVAVNYGGCISMVDASQLACGKSIEAYEECLTTACSGCVGSSDSDRGNCFAAADSGVCAAYKQNSDTCFTTLSGPGTSCFDVTTFMASQFCGF
jgi:hypothetical protein